jgi:hypothetical protein
MIYAIRITVDGKKFLRGDRKNVGIRRLVILTISSNNEWIEWTVVHSRLKEAYNKFIQQDEQTANQLKATSSKIVDDVIWLREKGLLETATYKSSDGRLSKERPIGMVFKG